MDPHRLGRRPFADLVAGSGGSAPPRSTRGMCRRDSEVVNELLIDGRIDLACNWTYAYRKVIEEAGRTDIGVYPGWQRAHVLGGEVLAVPRGAANAECAARLIDLLLTTGPSGPCGRLRWIPRPTPMTRCRGISPAPSARLWPAPSFGRAPRSGPPLSRPWLGPMR